MARVVKGRWSQIGQEQALRARGAAATHRGEKAAKNLREANKENTARLEATKEFSVRDDVTDGKIFAKVKRIDPKDGNLTVVIPPRWREARWDPRYTTKIKKRK